MRDKTPSARSFYLASADGSPLARFEPGQCCCPRGEAKWSQEAGSLLELAEANGLSVESNCRLGACGTCSTRLLAGEVAYPAPREAQIEPGHALICSAIPATTETGEESTVILDL